MSSNANETIRDEGKPVAGRYIKYNEVCIIPGISSVSSHILTCTHTQHKDGGTHQCIHPLAALPQYLDIHL